MKQLFYLLVVLSSLMIFLSCGEEQETDPTEVVSSEKTGVNGPTPPPNDNDMQTNDVGEISEVKDAPQNPGQPEEPTVNFEYPPSPLELMAKAQSSQITQ
ncbi:hypothetical protein WDW89_03040 [Deltaproteobacteria bacterium TL4]